MTFAVRANMSGTVWKVLVTSGQQVAADDEVLILESMKMEVPHEAGCDGVVGEICTPPETFVEEGDVLMYIEGKQS